VLDEAKGSKGAIEAESNYKPPALAGGS